MLRVKWLAIPFVREDDVAHRECRIDFRQGEVKIMVVSTLGIKRRMATRAERFAV